MAIHCDVCGMQLGSSRDNGGSFPVASPFQSRAPWRGGIIGDTCLRCAGRIRGRVAAAVDEAVDEIREELDAVTRSCGTCEGSLALSDVGTSHVDPHACIATLKERLGEG